MGRPRKIVEAIIGAVSPKKIVVEKAEVKEAGCSNCDNNGAQCSSCTPPFRDTFGE
jgi:hypothetical protein